LNVVLFFAKQILKVIVFIILTTMFPKALQSTVVLCITAVVSTALAIAGLHFRAAMLCFLVSFFREYQARFHHFCFG
jgi:hypothetical protein